MIEYRNHCVDCEVCGNCGRKHERTMVCDDCREEVNEMWYGADGGQYCKFCIMFHLEEVTD